MNFNLRLDLDCYQECIDWTFCVSKSMSSTEGILPPLQLVTNVLSVQRMAFLVVSSSLFSYLSSFVVYSLTFWMSLTLPLAVALSVLKSSLQLDVEVRLEESRDILTQIRIICCHDNSLI